MSSSSRYPVSASFKRGVALLLLSLCLFFSLAVADNTIPTHGAIRTRETSSRFFSDANTGENTTDFLHRVGLGMLLPLITDFIEPFENTVKLFSNLNQDEHFHILNLVLDSFKKSFVEAVSEVEKAQLMHDAPKGPISVEMMRSFLSQQESIMYRLIQRDPRIVQSDWMMFLDKLHHVFDGLYEIYKEIDSYGKPYGITLSWTWVSFLKTIIAPLPTNLFDRNMFLDVLEIPSKMKETVHYFVEEVVSSEQGHLVKMVAAFLTTVDWKNLTRNGAAKVEV